MFVGTRTPDEQKTQGSRSVLRIALRGVLTTCLLLVALTSVFGLLTNGVRHDIAPMGAVALEPCHIDGFVGEADCANYEVYENRATRSGRKITLKLVVIP